MAAPTLIAFAANEGLIDSGGAVTTASVSWQTGDVVVVIEACEGAGETLSTPTTTGTGVALGTAQVRHDATSSDCSAAIWAAVATGNSSGTWTASYGPSGAARATMGAVFVLRGSAGIGNSVITTSPSGTRTINLTPTGADSAICWVVGDWHADAVIALTPTPTTHTSGSPGPTALPYGVQAASHATYIVGDLDDQVSTGATAYGITGTGVGPFTIAAIEVKASAASGTTANAGLASASAAALAATAPYLTSGPNYGGAAADLGGNSGSWTNPGNAAGTDDNTYAVWTVP